MHGVVQKPTCLKVRGKTQCLCFQGAIGTTFSHLFWCFITIINIMCGNNKHVGNQGRKNLGTNEHINYNNDKFTVIPTIDPHITQLLITNEQKEEKVS